MAVSLPSIVQGPEIRFGTQSPVVGEGRIMATSPQARTCRKHGKTECIYSVSINFPAFRRLEQIAGNIISTHFTE